MSVYKDGNNFVYLIALDDKYDSIAQKSVKLPAEE